jgi:hypothetical protein
MKKIKFNLEGVVVEASLGTKIDKSALYGFVKTVAVKDEKILERAYLTEQGSPLRRSELFSEKVDPYGSVADELIAQIDGVVLDEIPSSFDRESTLEKVSQKILIGFNVASVYPIDECTLPSGFYKTSFNYRKGYVANDAVLLSVGENWFLFIGEFRNISWIGENVYYEFFETESDQTVEEEISFDML